MRIVVAFLTLGSVLPGAANAASIIAAAQVGQPEQRSIVAVGASSTSPSMVVAATWEPTSGSSIIALGEPSSKDEKVAAIGNESNQAARRLADTPMVIRGGIVGDAFVRAVPAAPGPADAPAATADAPPPDQPKPDAAATSSTASEQPAEPE